MHTSDMWFTSVIPNEKGKVVGFTYPPSRLKPRNPVLAGIVNLPAFEVLLGTKTNPFQGPAAVIGMNILSQRRIILESRNRDGSGRRSCSMFVSSD